VVAGADDRSSRVPADWWFYRHTLMGDLFFTAVFALAMGWRAKSAPSERLLRQRFCALSAAAHPPEHECGGLRGGLGRCKVKNEKWEAGGVVAFGVGVRA